MYASRYGEVDVAEFLVSKGADVNAKNDDGETVLMAACDMEYPEGSEPPSQSGHYLVVKLLLARGSDINVKMKNGTTALTLAYRHWHKQIVGLLVNAGAK
jgi:ankyrin repeat protein